MEKAQIEPGSQKTSKSLINASIFNANTLKVVFVAESKLV